MRCQNCRLGVFVLAIVLLIVVAFSCKSNKSKLLLEETENHIDSIIDARNYVFLVEKVFPVSGLVYEMDNTQKFFLRVCQDSIAVYLPSFDYAGTTLSNSSFIRFGSYDFDYKQVQREHDVHTIHILSHSQTEAYDFSMLVSNIGKATLYVKLGTDKSISFQGIIVNP